MKTWSILFIVWLILCGVTWLWLHPQSQVTEKPMGDLPGDLPGYEQPAPVKVIPIETH